jgi:alanine racemase
VVIHRLEQLQMLRQCRLPRRLSIYLKLNSGMNRLGLGAINCRPSGASWRRWRRLRRSAR